MKFLKNITILALLPLLLVFGCKDDDEVTILQPVVNTTNPIDQSVDVATNTAVQIMFNKDMKIETINNASFTIFNGPSKIEGEVTYADSMATFTPTVNLPASKLFNATVTTEAEDLSGHGLETNYTFSFTTGLAPDIDAPSVQLVSPLNDATDVSFDEVISVTFNEQMDASTINETSFTLKQGATLIAGSIDHSGASATLTPNSDLEAGKVYTATIAATVKDQSGNSMAQVMVWSFTTDQLPTITALIPLNDAVDVALNSTLSATFSEDMEASSIDENSFTLIQGSTSISGAVTYSDKMAVFTPDANLEAGLVYTAKLSADITNLNGNAIAEAKTWEFTTDALPSVIQTDPENNATSIVRNKVISATFSEAMNPSTINTNTFIVKQGSTEIVGTIDFSDNTARFIPNATLDASLTYEATITTGVKDLGGNSIVENEVWTFTTGTVNGLATVNLRASGNYVILAKTAINNIPTSAITGDMGLSPAATSYITGFGLTDATGYATSPQVTGKVYAADMASPTPSNLTTAVENMLTAYTDAASRPTPDFLNFNTGNIGGETLQAGLYKWGTTVTIPGDVTLSGTEDDVWIFQIDNDLTMSANKNIILTGGAKASNIFWQVAGEAVIGANSHFEGVILSMTAITLETGASFHGRMLAQTAVILDQNAVTKPE